VTHAGSQKNENARSKSEAATQTCHGVAGTLWGVRHKESVETHAGRNKKDERKTQPAYFRKASEREDVERSNRVMDLRTAGQGPDGGSIYIHKWRKRSALTCHRGKGGTA